MYVQIERHPYLTQQDLLAFHKQLGVVVTAYAPLGAPGLMGDQYVAVKPLLENEAVLAVATKHKKTAAQVLVQYREYSTVPEYRLQYLEYSQYPCQTVP